MPTYNVPMRRVWTKVTGRVVQAPDVEAAKREALRQAELGLIAYDNTVALVQTLDGEPCEIEWGDDA